MNNFGVIELATAKTTHAPGWAYVPDTAPSLSAAAIQPGHRKRAARNQNTASTSALYADADARQEAKLRREIEALDRDNYGRDVTIPIAAKGGSGKLSAKKHTPNVRKILQSQKTFANYLDDFDALSAADKAAAMGIVAPATATAAQGAGKKGAVAGEKGKGKRGGKSISRSASVSKPPPAAAAPVKQEDNPDIEMLDAAPSSTILTPLPPNGLPPTHPLDSDPLIMSRVPPLPTDAELRALMKAPPLTYAEARGRWTEDDRRYPARAFCEVCGYWGRVRCMKCGARACALECLETHREECVSRYGI
ncbi:uncharacterized protein GGS22DRAFT_13437 [Annulohypoxylon maeteangense]|uniref:uncharacterized protein n=1 Tax=Annulohypoxylon maeteangense TaxID=1927788 RepID=UPI002008CB95|nr:uncharacterized protein GGS22DRAFT_13437 [Annulohypoxylon maeteangense]KAI0890423.1 hypothetical protein GGS22DRAFT_13437 [Annulohypoxylon maeteangense]